ncbi:MAG: hypothetical protein GKC00_03015, partial [Candidatus Methanofastidiosa archaeon]|nr:hypothetical protein [Candidatus Methanofastidiosa archaeon]
IQAKVDEKKVEKLNEELRMKIVHDDVKKLTDMPYNKDTSIAPAVHIYSNLGEHLREFKTEGNVLSVSITPDGKNVVAGSTDSYIYFLDVESMAKPEKSSSSGNFIYIVIPIILIILASAVIYTKKFKKK